MNRPPQLSATADDLAGVAVDLRMILADGRVDEQELRRLREIADQMSGLVTRVEAADLSVRYAIQVLRLGVDTAPDRHLARTWAAHENASAGCHLTEAGIEPIGTGSLPS